MVSIKLLTHLYNFFLKIFIAPYINNDKWQMRNIKNYKSKSSDRLYNIFKKQSKNKKRIDDIREELKNPKYNISKSESKDIKRNLYNIEK